MYVAEYNRPSTTRPSCPACHIAIRTALARRGVAHLSFPNDVQHAHADLDACQMWPWPAPPAIHHRPAPPARARAEDLAAAARSYAGEKVAILARAGALHAREEGGLADRLAAPVIKTLPGKR